MDAAPEEQLCVWVISNEHWLRALLRAELIEQGYDATGYPTTDEAVAELSRQPLQKPRVLILDLTGQEITRHQFSHLAAGGTRTVLLGGAVDLADPVLGDFRWAAVMKRPFTIREIVAVVAREARTIS